ncbi:Protein of unknown function [Gryllus bimaculatus]|nr:Protein of unknown function [Gryllus bimaculatus]
MTWKNTERACAPRDWRCYFGASCRDEHKARAVPRPGHRKTDGAEARRAAKAKQRFTPTPRCDEKVKETEQQIENERSKFDELWFVTIQLNDSSENEPRKRSPEDNVMKYIRLSLQIIDNVTIQMKNRIISGRSHGHWATGNAEVTITPAELSCGVEGSNEGSLVTNVTFPVEDAISNWMEEQKTLREQQKIEAGPLVQVQDTQPKDFSCSQENRSPKTEDEKTETKNRCKRIRSGILHKMGMVEIGRVMSYPRRIYCCEILNSINQHSTTYLYDNKVSKTIIAVLEHTLRDVMAVAAKATLWMHILRASWLSPWKMGLSTQRYNLDKHTSVRRTVGYHMPCKSAGESKKDMCCCRSTQHTSAKRQHFWTQFNTGLRHRWYVETQCAVSTSHLACFSAVCTRYVYRPVIVISTDACCSSSRQTNRSLQPKTESEIFGKTHFNCQPTNSIKSYRVGTDPKNPMEIKYPTQKDCIHVSLPVHWCYGGQGVERLVQTTTHHHATYTAFGL